MDMAAVGAHSSALCGTAAGFSGIFCHVLEFDEDHSRCDCWTAPGGPSGGMGICKVGFYRQKNTPVVIYCADAVSVSDPDAVGIFNPESDGADRHTYGPDPARSIFNFSCIHYAPLFFQDFNRYH